MEDNYKKNIKDKFFTVRGYQMKSKEPLTPSMEDYLEMIYKMCKEKGYARIKELATSLNVRASSCTKIVQKLAKDGYLIYEKYAIIQLTKKGNLYGAYLIKRHKIIEEFLDLLGIKETIIKDTELLEHHISSELLLRLQCLNRLLKKNNKVYKLLMDEIANFNKE